MTRDAGATSARLAERIDELVRELLPNGRAQNGCWRVGNLSGAKGASLSITLSGDHQGRWRDFATSEQGDALDLVKCVLNCDTRAALDWSTRWLGRDRGKAHAPVPKDDRDDEARRIERALAIWDDSIDPRRTLVDTYLSGRALKLTDSLADDVIRHHRGCPWHDEATGRILRVPAMIVAMRSIATDEITAVQRTRLSSEGKKVARRMLGLSGGAAVKLDADARVTDTLHIGEGVETCMSAQQIGLRPTWALGSVGGIERFPVLDGVDTLTILAENDEASEHAAEVCGTRWYGAGREVFIIRPTSGNDLNDALREMRRSLRSASGRRRAS